MIIVEHPRDCAPETAYVLAVVFDVFFGIPYSTVPVDGDAFRLRADDDGVITLPSVFLKSLEQNGRAVAGETALQHWDSRATGWDLALIDPVLPVPFGKPTFEVTDRRIDLGIDIFGAVFFMLSRHEEVGGERHDEHGRYPAKHSMAYRQGFLLRPIVDEYVEVLFSAMQHLWPRLERRARQASVMPTHDVDIPYLGLSLSNTRLLLQRCAGDLLKRRSPALAARTIRSSFSARAAAASNGASDPFADDPFNVFDWFMELSEEAGVPSRFYFMTDHEPDDRYGGGYDIEAAHIKALITRLAARGHEIGIHPTGQSYRDREALLGQSAHFMRAFDACGLDQDIRGGRHHYLRWRMETTPRFWHDAGLDYDCTLGYADHVGFRCGTCHAFPLWDHERRERLDVVERPLIVMECTLLDDAYMGCDPDVAAALVRQLQSATRTVKGEFVFLWHNSALTTSSDRALYRVCLDL
ncbi:MAG: polysaccharide deacetylase family protein [Geminicoccaceae bacterium]